MFVVLVSVFVPLGLQKKENTPASSSPSKIDAISKKPFFPDLLIFIKEQTIYLHLNKLKAC